MENAGDHARLFATEPSGVQIAATALIYDLTVVTRNTAHYEPTGVALLNPFT